MSIARLVRREGGIFAKGHEIGIVGDVSYDSVNSRQLGANHFTLMQSGETTT